MSTAARLLAVLVLVSPTVAQDAAGPDADLRPLLRPFARLVGQFAGEGTFRPGPGAEPVRWSATVDAHWILDGHFVEEDVEVRVGDAAVLQTRTLFGRDQARERYVAVSVANDGRCRLSELSWVTPDRLVAVTRDDVDGRPVLVRSSWDFGDGRYAYALARAVGAGAWETAVEGSFAPVDALPPRAADDSRGGAALGAEMARLAPLVGSYELEAERLDAAGRTLLRAAGRDAVRAMYGGQILAARMTLAADGATRTADRYTGWSVAERRYRVFAFDDAGGVGLAELRWDGEDALVGEVAESDGTETVLASTRVELGAQGLLRVLTRTVRGTGEVLDDVAVRYRRATDAGTGRGTDTEAKK